MSRAEIQILVKLAQVDGIVVQDEIDLIKQIGEAKGMSQEEVAQCFNEAEYDEDLSLMSDDNKYEFLYNIIQLMKIDGRLYKEELNFCAKMASRLGYDEEVLLELILKIYRDPDITTDKAHLKSTIQKYLKH
jgi:hypothetical protein